MAAIGQCPELQGEIVEFHRPQHLCPHTVGITFPTTRLRGARAAKGQFSLQVTLLHGLVCRLSDLCHVFDIHGTMGFGYSESNMVKNYPSESWFSINVCHILIMLVWWCLMFVYSILDYFYLFLFILYNFVGLVSFYRLLGPPCKLPAKQPGQSNSNLIVVSRRRRNGVCSVVCQWKSTTPLMWFRMDGVELERPSPGA